MSENQGSDSNFILESVYLNTTLNFEIPAALVFDRSLLQGLLTGLTAQQLGTTARWHSNKTPLCYILNEVISI